MLEFLQQFSDNQLALAGCVVALGGAMLLLSASFHSRPQSKPIRTEDDRAAVTPPSRRKAA